MSVSMLIDKVPPLPLVFTLGRAINNPLVNSPTLNSAVLYSARVGSASVISSTADEELKLYAQRTAITDSSPPKIVALSFFRNLSLAGSPKDSSGLVYLNG